MLESTSFATIQIYDEIVWLIKNVLGDRSSKIKTTDHYTFPFSVLKYLSE